MAVAKPESRVLKTIYTLKSGKSIVVSMLEDECIRVYNEWINYILITIQISYHLKLSLKRKKIIKLLKFVQY